MDAAAYNARCSIARSVEVLGDKWSPLIIREAFRGVTRFTDFRDALGIARDVLAARLATFVEMGLMEKRSYREDGSRERAEYVLTDAGRDLRALLAAYTAWGDVHRPTDHGPTAEFVDSATSRRVHLAFVDEGGAIIPADRVESVFTAAAFADHPF